MPIAALYDIHGNLPALEAVLAEVRRLGVDQIVVGGDVLPGPMPRECLARLLSLHPPVRFIQGNGELAVLALLAAPSEDAVTYWGTTSGRPMPEQYRPAYRWTAQQVAPDYAAILAGWPRTLRTDVDALGPVLFCHGTPRSETEIFTRLTPDESLRPIFEPLGVSLVVCGHTHMQFDRTVGRTRVVNAGSVGEPYESPEACWLLLGPGAELRRTPYDVPHAAEQIRATAYPAAEASARDLLHPPRAEDMLKLFTPWQVK